MVKLSNDELVEFMNLGSKLPTNFYGGGHWKADKSRDGTIDGVRFVFTSDLGSIWVTVFPEELDYDVRYFTVTFSDSLIELESQVVISHPKMLLDVVRRYFEGNDE